MKLKFKNFQALKSEEMTITPGLTLLNGPTNSGKTAVFRALLSLLTNPAEATGFINGSALQEKDNSELSVTIEDEDIPKIEFHRNKSSAWYMIGGKKYSKLQRSNIFDIYPELHKKFIYEPMDPRKVLNFQTEEHLAFPFDRSDAEMFKLFERIFNITDTRAIIDTIRKEKDETKCKIELTTVEKQNSQQKLEEYKKDFNEINKELISAYTDQYKFSASKINILANKIQTIQNYFPYLKETQFLPEFQNLNSDEAFNHLLVLQQKVDECRTKNAYVENYTDLELSSMEEDQALKLQELASKLAKVQKCNSELEKTLQLQKIEEQNLEEMEKRLAEFKICPLCGHEL